MWIQRTQAVGQVFRQHGNDPAGEINRSAAPLRLFVQFTAGAHIKGNIGNGDKQLPALTARLAINRVIKIFRIFTVNGDKRQRAQIFSMR